MKVRVADYIANFLINNDITRVFSVVGGGAMHLNDAFGHNPRIKCIYHHHEQACAMAAEGYAKLRNAPAVVCVTSGPGGINALNGVAGAYQDSIPMLVLSGQVKRLLLEKESGLKLRSLGGQEFDIVSAVGKMTKFAETVMEPEKIRWYLEKAYLEAITGRPGPTWLDIPVDVQGAYIEEDELEAYDAHKLPTEQPSSELFDREALVRQVYQRLTESKRPVLYAGNGIRLAGAMESFQALTECLQIPVVTCWDSIDLIENENELYCGRGGIMGDRAGNFAVQNSDFLLCIGNRLTVNQVGYDVDTWAREAFVVSVDIDSNELEKKTIRVDLPVCMDARVFIEGMLTLKESVESLPEIGPWRARCAEWKSKYPVVTGRQLEQEEPVNVYAFLDVLSRSLPEGSVTVAANASASVAGSQTWYAKKGSRYIINGAMGSMGYGLPASIGAAVAVRDAKQESITVCIEGDGSIMMNLQELMTVSTNKLPIKLFVINNGGYHQIRQTQNNIFKNGVVGIGPESGDLGFPDFSRLTQAFGLSYESIRTKRELSKKINAILAQEGSILCEVYVDTKQAFEPKSATKQLEDGTLVSPPLEDMAPFLPREELQQNMIVPMV